MRSTGQPGWARVARFMGWGRAGASMWTALALRAGLLFAFALPAYGQITYPGLALTTATANSNALKVSSSDAGRRCTSSVKTG